MTYRIEESDQLELDRTPCDARDLAARAGITLDDAGNETYSPRDRLAAQTREMWHPDHAKRNLRADSLKHLAPRDRLAVEVRDFWRGGTR